MPGAMRNVHTIRFGRFSRLVGQEPLALAPLNRKFGRNPKCSLYTRCQNVLNALKSWFFFRHSYSMGFPLNFKISIGQTQRNINLFSQYNLFIHITYTTSLIERLPMSLRAPSSLQMLPTECQCWTDVLNPYFKTTHSMFGKLFHTWLLALSALIYTARNAMQCTNP